MALKEARLTELGRLLAFNLRLEFTDTEHELGFHPANLPPRAGHAPSMLVNRQRTTEARTGRMRWLREIFWT